MISRLLKWFRNEHPPHIHDASLIEKCIEKEMERVFNLIKSSRWVQSRCCSVIMSVVSSTSIGRYCCIGGYVLLEHRYNRHPSHPQFLHQCYFVMGFVIWLSNMIEALAHEHLESYIHEWNRDFYVGHKFVLKNYDMFVLGCIVVLMLYEIKNQKDSLMTVKAP